MASSPAAVTAVRDTEADGRMVTAIRPTQDSIVLFFGGKSIHTSAIWLWSYCTVQYARCVLRTVRTVLHRRVGLPTEMETR